MQQVDTHVDALDDVPGVALRRRRTGEPSLRVIFRLRSGKRSAGLRGYCNCHHDCASPSHGAIQHLIISEIWPPSQTNPGRGRERKGYAIQTEKVERKLISPPLAQCFPS
jgi:hypothetical protein